MKSIYLLYLLLFMSCQYEKKKDDIDAVINKYDKTDFSFFKNTFIGIRERNRDGIIYIVDKAEGNVPIYFVKYSMVKEGVIDINKAVLKEKKTEGYFTDKEIINIIKKFRELDLLLLKVDKEGNVFINPFRINEPAVLLRLSNSSNDKEIREGYVYYHYKDNWYIRK